jgi:serine/threonine-protein kinase
VTPAADLDELAAEFLAAAERGAAPDPAEWLARHPAHAAELAAFLADLGRFGSFLGLPPPPSHDETVEFRPSPGADADGSGERFGEYELLGELGRGGMGVVYRARLSGTSLVVALKQLTGDGADAARFRSEVESAAQLRHPNIVPVYHVGEHAGRPFFTMRLVEGGTLDRQVARHVADPLAAARLVAAVARAVHHAHQRRVLHRDLKPANILLDEAGEPHVADFGLAARTDEAGAVAAVPPAGSLPWMAPEAVRGDATLTTTVDVWALGVILYELLTGVRPFRGATAGGLRAAVLGADPPPPRAVNPRAPRDLDAICRRCLARDPDRRYESASAVALDLERWLRDEPVRARRAGRGERAARWCRRNPGLAAAAGLTAAGLVALAAAALSLARGQDAVTRQLVCAQNEHAAELAAGAFLRRIEHHAQTVRDAADDADVRRACADGRMDAARDLLRTRIEATPAPGTVGLASMFLLDDGGVMRAIWPEKDRIVGTRFADRDYFAGARERAGRPEPEQVHLSRVFPSKNDHRDKLALSVAFRVSGPGDGREWVLGASIPTDPTLGLGITPDGRRAVALLAPRDTGRRPDPGEVPEYVVLVHPGYSADAGHHTAVPFPADRLRPAPSADGRPRFAPDEDYADPVGGQNPAYAGRWLAGFAAVEGTDLVVVEQQQYDAALAPHRAFAVHLLAWAGGVAAAGLAVFAGLALVRGRAGRVAS